MAPAAPRRHVSTAAAYHLGHLEPFPSKKEAKEHFKCLKKIHEPRNYPSSAGISFSGAEIHPGHEDFQDLWDLWHHHPKANASHHKYFDKYITHFTVEKFNNTDEGRFLSSRFCVHFSTDSNMDSSKPRAKSRANSRCFSWEHCLDNKQHALTTKKGGWAGPVAPKTSGELAEAKRKAIAFAAKWRDQLGCNIRQTPDSVYFGFMRTEVVWDIHTFKNEHVYTICTGFTCPINGTKVQNDCHVDHFDPPFAVLA